MDLGLLHPIAQYIFWSFIIICTPFWVLDMTTLLKLRSRKFRNEEIIVSLSYFILFIGYLIFSSFAFVFFAFAGLVINFSFWWTLLLMGYFAWWLLDYIKAFSISYPVILFIRYKKWYKNKIYIFYLKLFCCYGLWNAIVIFYQFGFFG